MILSKISAPGWRMEFDTEHELVDVLRKHICQSCLVYGSGFSYTETSNNGEKTYIEDLSPPVDHLIDGVMHECRDIPTLLGTPCGLEYEVTEGYLDGTG